MAKEIVYWRGQGEPIVELISSLSDKSYKVSIANSLEVIFDRFTTVVPATIIVDATSADSEVGNKVVQLTGAEKLYGIPVVFLGRQASSRSDILARQFEHFFPIDMPLSIPILVDHIDLVCSSTDLGSVRKKIQSDNLEFQKSQRHAVDPKHLSSSFGGRIFAEASSLADFDDQIILPEHPKREVVESAIDELTQKDESLGVRIRRVSFASSALANKLKFSEERDNNIKTVSLLLNEGLYRENPALTKVDFSQLNSKAEFEALAAGFRRSADFMDRELSDSKAARTTSVLADIMLGKTPQEESQIIEDARCALAAESMDRACWTYGEWNAQGAYRLMRGMRGESFLDSDPKMAETLVRFLAEAVDSQKNNPTIFVPRKAQSLEEKQAIDALDQQAQKDFASSAQMKVDFPHLQPGMRLARPLLSVDGALVLPANTELDKDLILRLLQLSSIRPMQTPIVISSSVRSPAQV